MRRNIYTAVGGFAAVLLLAGTAAAKSTSEPHSRHGFPRVSTTDGAPVELDARPGSAADLLARQLMAREIDIARRHGENPLVLVGMGRLNDTDEMLFVQLQSPSECGSAGCSTASFKYVNGRWIKTLDTIGGVVRIAPSRHHGMPDVIVNNNRLIWDGGKYREIG